ncbi:glycosyl transferase family 14 [Variovorax beijingensis]|uniref:Peptide O-xylosyltransferase n=1 Tax=Variovorax beijingensis TaxID=2496117 RepID=A0A3P3EEZ2_9BURK|nr:beta-1,6-N-acetylglucosaminyltransferase [Variovorax beijingensis]RRH83758.1 glycosyl transferase family 14 [Variovorax beijingensis]
MSPVFLLLVHADPQQAKRLLRRLVPVGRCIVHVDAKAELSAFRIDDPRASYVKDRVDVRWGAISQVDATLRLMRTALAECEVSQVSHFMLLSGNCYPLRPLEEFRTFSQLHAGSNFIKMIPLASTRKLHERVRHFWFYEDLPVDGRKFTLARLSRGLLQFLGKLGRRSFPLVAQWHFGSQWWALTPEAVSYLVSYPHEASVKRFLRFSKAPDEIYFHTLLANSPLQHTVEPVSGSGVWDAANLHLIDPSLSRWFHTSDYEEIVASGKWFVRKVGSGISSDLCDRLDCNGNHNLVAQAGKETA